MIGFAHNGTRLLGCIAGAQADALYLSVSMSVAVPCHAVYTCRRTVQQNNCFMCWRNEACLHCI